MGWKKKKKKIDGKLETERFRRELDSMHKCFTFFWFMWVSLSFFWERL